MKPNPDYPIKNYCAAVAFLINCDNLQYPFTDKKFDAQTVFNCNSHGELFGVLGACEIVRRAIDIPDGTPEFKSALDTIVKGGSINPDTKFTSSLGLLCMTLLYQMPKEFQEAVDSIFRPQERAKSLSSAIPSETP